MLVEFCTDSIIPFFPSPYIFYFLFSPGFFEFFVQFQDLRIDPFLASFPFPVFFLLLVSENLNSADIGIIASLAILHNFPRFPRPWPSEPAVSESS